jgi:hypothetical protein
MSETPGSYVVIKDGHESESVEQLAPVRWHRGVLQQKVRVTTWVWARGYCDRKDMREEWRAVPVDNSDD